MSSKDKTLIADLMESFVSDVPANPFVSFCVECNKGVIKEEMIYEKGKVFHKDCYTKYGNNYPSVNQELLNVNTNAKVQLVQLKNLKVRMMGGLNQNNTKPKAKKKLKRKTKKRLAKTRISRKKTRVEKKKTKRRKLIKRKKSSQKTKRSKRKGVRRRPSRRIRKKSRNRR